MANIQIGKYKRPGIFIEEFDQSVISSPVVEGITNLVIGVSKKGPVNTPIRLTSMADLESIFGQLDRGLERKGSFFHRTISKMLETAPVFAMNLLLTDDTLDVMEYKSISASSGFDNDIKREGPYRRFFDTTGFWKRDTESFINLTKESIGYTERAFNFTNLSDRPITVFVFKSNRTGFDRTILEWYGSIERIPPYVSAQDYASDYLLDVVVVGGDWSNYQELAVDRRWSAYFNASGLRKEQVRNFANDRNVTLLAFYEGLSLIPYFRDLNGSNIFIETTINRDTDTTGLFCSFNNDLVEEDFYNGRLDLIGNTIVGIGEKNIEFLSYKELIAEKIEIKATPLDIPGNVTSLLGSNGYNEQRPHAFGGDINGGVSDLGIVRNGNRTAWFAEGSVYGVTGGSASVVISTSTITIDYFVDTDAFAVIGDSKIDLVQGVSLELNVSDYPITSATASYVAVVVIGEDGQIALNTTLSPSRKPSVSSSDIVLGYVEFDIVYPGDFINVRYKDVTIDSDGFIDLKVDDDYKITNEGNGSIKVRFIGTSNTQNVTNYEQFRRFKMFNRLVNLLDSPNRNRMAMYLGSSGNKYRLEDASISNIVLSTLEDKSFILNTKLSENELTEVYQDGYLVLYTIDNEVIFGTNGLETKDSEADLEMGVVSKDSLLYRRFFDGIINTKDYFTTNRLYVNDTGVENDLLGKRITVEFIDGEDKAGLTSLYAGYDYIIFKTDGYEFDEQVSLMSAEQIQIPSSIRNPGVFTILGDNVTNLNPAQLATALGFTASDCYAYQVNEEVEHEELSNVDLIYDFNDRIYLKMYIENDGDMIVEFNDELLAADKTINTLANNTIFIQSRKSNLKQTVEIEIPVGYIREPNKILINASRYTEIKVGDFLEAFVDPNVELEPGQMPRRLTRILSKRQYLGDTTLTEITCDSRIQIYNFGNNDLQTMRYVSIDNYATTYKAISLKGFKVRANSLPDGTEGKQNQILNLVAKGTPMFKAITNKEAIDFRYLIDSFGLGLTERSKQQLVDICGDRLDAFGFINMPSLRSFKNSSSPSFVNREGVLQTSFVAQGGDPESNPAFLYSFGDGPGVTAVGYFTPYLTVNDNGRPLDMPPASYVATTYMRKHISNITSITPWTIAAGVTNGRVTNIVGLEMDFTLEDIENLNQAQMNPIVFKRNRGYVIETENTGQTLYKSSLSFIHVREVLIELERELSRMLLDYQWKFNTPDIRAEIKLRADVICETYVSKNGLFNYFNKMDDENNTPEIIDNQIGVLDTYVEPIKGMGIIVNNITILRTGAISAGGFINS
jgi:hypothetical protein